MSKTTPAAQWRENGKSDPHGDQYNCDRALLCLGNLTDDELANAVFLHGDSHPSPQEIISGKAHLPIVYLTAAKERIRWLSRGLEKCRQEKNIMNPQWIEAQTEAPKSEGQYWVHWSDGEIEIAHFLFLPYGNCFQRSCGTNEHHEGWNGNIGHVTHWQPSNKPTTKPTGENYG